MRKTIGNIFFIIGGVSLLIFLFLIVIDSDVDLEIFAILYAIGFWGGVILRIGDFFKWRAKKHHEGIMEAMAESSRFCPYCGKGLNAETAFCPHCGNKL